MPTKLPKNYFLDISEDWNQPLSSVFTLWKKRVFHKDQPIISIDFAYIPRGAERNEIKEYLTSQAWIDKNGKMKADCT